jgi:hypothetical protein
MSTLFRYEARRTYRPTHGGFPYSQDDPSEPILQRQGEYIAQTLTREVHSLSMNRYRMLALTAVRTTFLVGFAALLILVLLPLAVAAQAAAR